MKKMFISELNGVYEQNVSKDYYPYINFFNFLQNSFQLMRSEISIYK